MNAIALDVEEPLDDAYVDDDENEPLRGRPELSQPIATHSQHVLTRQEITRGIANRFVHSRTYIVLYLVMAALSITTIALNLVDDCPGLAFYILEVIINTTMIAEVSIRFVAFGRQFWRSPFNIMDLLLTMFCAITLLVLAFAGCGSTSRQEEILDTLLLVSRNVLQFTRLAAVMRQSGQSIFSRPKPIDLSIVNSAHRTLDFDMDDEESATRVPGDDHIVFDAQTEDDRAIVPPKPLDRAPPILVPDDRDAEDVWASIG